MNSHGIETTLYSLAGTPPRRPERRSSERHLSLLRVGAISIGTRRELCLIRNISAGGMMVRAYSDLEPGERLSIELKQGDPVTGMVQWVEDGLTGIAFDSPVDIVTLLSPLSPSAPRPRMPRVEIQCTASVRLDADLYRAKVMNISQGGLCIEPMAGLAPNSDVVVTLPEMAPIAGVVKWRDDAGCGIGFNRVLSLPDLVRWLQDQNSRRLASADL